MGVVGSLDDSESATGLRANALISISLYRRRASKHSVGSPSERNLDDADEFNGIGLVRPILGGPSILGRAQPIRFRAAFKLSTGRRGGRGGG